MLGSWITVQKRVNSSLFILRSSILTFFLCEMYVEKSGPQNKLHFSSLHNKLKDANVTPSNKAETYPCLPSQCHAPHGLSNHGQQLPAYLENQEGMRIIGTHYLCTNEGKISSRHTHENWSILAVSCFPVNLLSFPSP